MKAPLSFGLIVAVTGALACSDSGDGVRPGNGGTGPTGNTGGTSAGTAGSGGGTAGTGMGTGGTAGTGTGGDLNLGPALSITGTGLDTVVTDTLGNTGINGGVIVAQSSVMLELAVNTSRDGGLCMKGATAVVPDGTAYGTHWGAALSLDLNRGANPNASDAGASDAGADAGDAGGGTVLGTVAQPWPVGNVIGFSYKIVGQDATLMDKGVSANAFRFRGFPEGGSDSLDTYCSTRSPIDGAVENVKLTDITFECWELMPVNPSLAADPLPYSPAAGMEATRPNPGKLMNISWQVPADLSLAHKFDFCIEDLKPILAN